MIAAIMLSDSIDLPIWRITACMTDTVGAAQSLITTRKAAITTTSGSRSRSNFKYLPLNPRSFALIRSM